MYNILTLAVYSVLAMVFALLTYFFVPAILGWRLGKPLERMVGGKSASFQILVVILIGFISILFLSIGLVSAQTRDIGGFPTDGVPFLMIAVLLEMLIGVPLMIFAHNIKLWRHARQN